MLLFSHSVTFSSLGPHGLEHARLSCPSPSPGACSNSYLLSRWCHPTISSSIIPFSSCLQFFSSLGSFPMSWLFLSGCRNIEVSDSVFNFRFNPSYSGLICFRIDWFDLLAVQGNSQESSPVPQFKSISSSALSLLHSPTLTSIHDHWKNHSLD